MADENKNENEKEVTPGTPEFDHMAFRLKQAVNEENLRALDYDGNQLQKIQDNVYVMPAYIDKNFNLFFVVSPLIENDWIIAFSKATSENGNEITDLSEPIPTGEGLNQLGEHSPEDANKILKYFNTLVDAGRGEWKLVKYRMRNLSSFIYVKY